jgi:hypothetical protein
MLRWARIESDIRLSMSTIRSAFAVYSFRKVLSINWLCIGVFKGLGLRHGQQKTRLASILATCQSDRPAACVYMHYKGIH